MPSRRPNLRRAGPLLAFILLANCGRRPPLTADRTVVPADGISTIHLNTSASIAEGARFGKLESPTLLRATILPGRIVLSSGLTKISITTTRVDTDSAHDGTPDFLRLDTPADQSAFRRWFTYLAEAQFFRRPLPREVNDCAALIRYSYREALSNHNDAWIAAARLPEVPGIPAVEKYAYPYTPLGANLFRIRPGEFSHADLSNGAFARFADAETLLQFNTRFITKDVEQSMPGDILWFRQLSQLMPFHTMVYLGASQLDRTPGPYVVYHTGPQGEVRRVTVAELQHHPDPRWRPFPANSNFLGIYRWNVL